MTRFDADIGDPAHSTWRAVRAVVYSQPAVFAVTVAVGSVALTIVICVLAIGQGVRAQVALAAGRTQASVYLAPQLARADADALRGRIEAIPTVSRAVLRTREEAVTALARDGLPALVDKPNPLPDVWVVTLRPQGLESTLQGDASAAREALAALPGVASVTVDERWIAAMDRWAPVAAQLVAAANTLAFIALTGLLGCLGFVAARAASAHHAGDAGVRVFATIGILSGVASLLIAAAVVWGVAKWVAAAGIDLNPMVELAGQSLVHLAAGVGAVAIVASLAGMLVGAIKR